MSTKREPPNKGRKFPPSPPTPEEAARIVKACVKRPARPSATGLRNAALLVTLWRAGLRCAEACGLLPSDLEPALGQIRIREGKGRKPRVAVMDSDAWGVVGRWMDRRERLGFTGRQPVFVTLSKRAKGNALTGQYARRLAAEAAARAGVEKRIAPHQFRHAHAVALQNAGVPVYAIQAQLGHSCAGTTQTYLSALNPQEVAAAVANVPWPELAALKSPGERAADEKAIRDAINVPARPAPDDDAIAAAVNAALAANPMFQAALRGAKGEKA